MINTYFSKICFPNTINMLMFILTPYKTNESRQYLTDQMNKRDNTTKKIMNEIQKDRQTDRQTRI